MKVMRFGVSLNTFVESAPISRPKAWRRSWRRFDDSWLRWTWLWSSICRRGRRTTCSPVIDGCISDSKENSLSSKASRFCEFSFSSPDFFLEILVIGVHGDLRQNKSKNRAFLTLFNPWGHFWTMIFLNWFRLTWWHFKFATFYQHPRFSTTIYQQSRFLPGNLEIFLSASSHPISLAHPLFFIFFTFFLNSCIRNPWRWFVPHGFCSLPRVSSRFFCRHMILDA